MLEVKLTVRPKNLLRRKRLSATEMKHVPSNIIKDRSALFGNWLSSLVIDVELLFNKNEDLQEDFDKVKSEYQNLIQLQLVKIKQLELFLNFNLVCYFVCYSLIVSVIELVKKCFVMC